MELIIETYTNTRADFARVFFEWLLFKNVVYSYRVLVRLTSHFMTTLIYLLLKKRYTIIN